MHVSAIPRTSAKVMKNRILNKNFGTVYRIDLSAARRFYYSEPAKYPRLEVWIPVDGYSQRGKSVSVTFVYKGNRELLINTPMMGCRINVETSMEDEILKTGIGKINILLHHGCSVLHPEIKKFLDACERFDAETKKESKKRV